MKPKKLKIAVVMNKKGQWRAYGENRLDKEDIRLMQQHLKGELFYIETVAAPPDPKMDYVITPYKVSKK